MKYLFCVVKRIPCDFVYCTDTIENMMKCLKKNMIVISALKVLKMYILLVKIVPKRIKKNCIIIISYISY